MKRAALALMAATAALPAAAQTAPTTPAEVETRLGAMSRVDLGVYCANLGTQGAPAAGTEAVRAVEYRVCAANGQNASALMSFRGAVLSGQMTPVCSHVARQRITTTSDGTTLNSETTVGGIVAINGAQLQYIRLPDGAVLSAGNLNNVPFMDMIMIGTLINARNASMLPESRGSVVGCPANIMRYTGVTVRPAAPGGN